MNYVLWCNMGVYILSKGQEKALVNYLIPIHYTRYRVSAAVGVEFYFTTRFHDHDNHINTYRKIGMVLKWLVKGE